MFQKISSISPAQWLWGIFVLSLASQAVWCGFAAYPAAFEYQLRRSKPWVYVPLRWKGFHKFLFLSVARLIHLGIALSAMALLSHYTRWKEPLWARALMTLAFFFLAARLGMVWAHARYRQQENVYYLLHDDLRLKLDREGKDYTGAQFRSLAAYQHQQRLRKADESGNFLSSLSREARLARQTAATLKPALRSAEG